MAATDVNTDGFAGRRQSIGTLTGWQLLAQQELAKTDSDASKQAHDQAVKQKRGMHMRSLSSCSTTSDDSGLTTAAAANVTPRPHQWLYKEYKIQDEIGSGGFGRVCRARRLTDGKVVVVKEIKTTSLSAKQKNATMDEVEVLAKLNHPNIVKYMDCFMDDVYINIVMEYCNAGDLAGLIKRRQGNLLPESEVMSLFVQICLALQYVHAAGVLHRDLKSSNVLMTTQSSFGAVQLLKLGDFGVAKMNGPESSMASTIVGTPQYLSPEMCDNKPYGKKSDIWALGCILYELCSLQKAFDLGNGGISGIILKIMRGVYNPLPSSYSSELQDLVARLLQTDPALRPSVLEILNMTYVRQHLGSFLDWARNVPEAHPEVLLASLGETFRSSSGGSRTPLVKVSRVDCTGAGNSSGVAAAGGRLLTPADYTAAAAAAGLRLESKVSSSSESLASPGNAARNNMSPASVKHTELHGAYGSARSPLRQQQQQQQQQQYSNQNLPADLATKSLSGWLDSGSTLEQRQHLLQQQQQVLQQQMQQVQVANAAAVSAQSAQSALSAPIPVMQAQAMQQQQQYQTSRSNVALAAINKPSVVAAAAAGHPQQQQQFPPSTLTPAAGESSCASDQTAYMSEPESNRGSGGSGGSHSISSGKLSLAQEQMEGLRRLRGLKARLQVMHSDSSLGSSIHPQTPDHREMLQHHQHDRHRHQAPLSTLMSLDHEASHASAAL